jgi:hypothetical protein
MARANARNPRTLPGSGERATPFALGWMKRCANGSSAAAPAIGTATAG